MQALQLRAREAEAAVSEVEERVKGLRAEEEQAQARARQARQAEEQVRTDRPIQTSDLQTDRH